MHQSDDPVKTCQTKARMNEFGNNIDAVKQNRIQHTIDYHFLHSGALTMTSVLFVHFNSVCATTYIA